MPLTYEIDTEKKLIRARAFDILTEKDIMDYLDAVWSVPLYHTYNELVDMNDVKQIDYQSTAQVVGVVKAAAKSDSRTQITKLALVAAGDEMFGMSRLYQSYRETQASGNKIVHVFRTLDEALAWLDAK